MSSEYQFVPFDLAMANNHHEICIVDLASWDEVNQWLRKHHSHELYRLLVIAEDKLDQLAPDIQQQIDDVITTPLRISELHIRLRNLVRSRKYSTQMRWLYSQLSTTNLALESVMPL